MRGRKLIVNWQHSADELMQLYKRTKNPQSARRIHALALLRQGKTLTETATLLGVSARAIQNWLAWYRTDGLHTLTQRAHGGWGTRPPRPLTPQQQARLVQQAATHGFASIQDAIRWCARELGVSLSYPQMYKLFRRLGLRRKVPRPMAVGADAALQAQWKKGGL